MELGNRILGNLLIKSQFNNMNCSFQSCQIYGISHLYHEIKLEAQLNVLFCEDVINSKKSWSSILSSFLQDCYLFQSSKNTWNPFSA